MSYTISEQLIVVMFLMVGLLITPLFFIALDFWAGIRKAHTRGDRIRSDKMQRTIQKLSRYYNAILANGTGCRSDSRLRVPAYLQLLDSIHVPFVHADSRALCCYD